MSAKALRVGRAKALAVGIAATSVAVLGEAGGTDLHGAAVSPDRERRAAVDPRTEWAGAELELGDDARVLVAFRGTNGGTGPHEAAVSLEEASSPDGEEVPHEAGGATSGGAGYGEPDGHMVVVCCEEQGALGGLVERGGPSTGFVDKTIDRPAYPRPHGRPAAGIPRGGRWASRPSARTPPAFRL